LNFTVLYLLSAHALEIKPSEQKDKSAEQKGKSVSQAWEYWISVAVSALHQTKVYLSLES